MYILEKNREERFFLALWTILCYMNKYIKLLYNMYYGLINCFGFIVVELKLTDIAHKKASRKKGAKLNKLRLSVRTNSTGTRMFGHGPSFSGLLFGSFQTTITLNIYTIEITKFTSPCYNYTWGFFTVHREFIKPWRSSIF